MRIGMAVLAGVFALFTQIAMAQTDMQENLFNQLKSSIEKSCQNQDYLKCINVDEQSCNSITENELVKIGDILEAHSQAIENGDFAPMLEDIKAARKAVLEQNNIDIETANACGKTFLSN